MSGTINGKSKAAMTTAFGLLLLGTAFCALAGPTTEPTNQPTSQPSKTADVAPPWVPHERYDVLWQRNLFVRGSSPGSGSIFGNSTPSTQPSTEPASTSPAQASPESAWVLTGTALGASKDACLIENTLTGAAVRLRVGESIEVGKIVAIDTDGISLQSKSGTKRIGVGSTMDGVASTAPLPAGWSQIPTPDPANASGSGGSSGSGGGSSDEASILEKLKKRRAQELNGK